ESAAEAARWAAAYRASPLYQQYVAARLPAATAAPSPPTPPKRSSQSMLAQIHIQAWRALGLLRRDRVSLLLLLGQAPLVAGLLLLLVQPDTLLGMHQAGQVQRGAAGQLLFVLVLAGLWFGIISAARSIASERLIYERERRAGLSIIAYLVAKLAVLGGLALLQTALLLGTLSLGIAYPPDAGVLLPLPLELFGTLLLAALAGVALGVLVSAAAPTPERALSVVPVLLIVQILFAGQVFPIAGSTSTLLSQATLSRWAMDALGATLNLNTFCDLPNLATADGSARPPWACALGTLRWRPDEAFPDAYTATADHLRQAWGVLGGYLLLYSGLAGVLLWLREQRIGWRVRLRRMRKAVPPAPAPQTTPALPIMMQHLATRSARSGREEPTLIAPAAVVDNQNTTFPLLRTTAGQYITEPTVVVSATHADEHTTLRPIAAEQEPLPDTAPAAPDSTMPHISRYTIEVELGSRGLFTTYRAYDPLTRRRVAIKVLQAQYCSTVANARFRRAVEQVAALELPAIARVYDSGEIDGQPFEVMQYLAGGSLSARMLAGPLPISTLVPIVERVAAALDEAHTHGLIHRSLKPTAILFNEQQQAVLADFGTQMIPRTVRDLGPAGAFDACYLSPEQVRLAMTLHDYDDDDAPPDDASVPQSDIYALGALVFHSLTGSPLYLADTPWETARAHLYREVPPMSRLAPGLPMPRGCQSLIERALAKDPADRYPLAREFADDLRQLATGRWFLAQLFSDTETAPPAARHRPACR
ncbi:MAG: serine/threonine protein kinase, partial [Chloroflexaceae bacterium]|nr:serine/threonine protein kinase [Chloroflexaceae bacterium]